MVLLFIGDNLVTSRSKEQCIVAQSSAEAENRSMAHGMCKVFWIRTLLQEIGFVIQVPMSLYYDNKATISVAHNPV